jgi:hypothetical protein
MSSKEKYEYEKLESFASSKTVTEKQAEQVISSLEDNEELVYQLTLNASFPIHLIEKLTEHSLSAIRYQSFTSAFLSTEFLEQKVNFYLNTADKNSIQNLTAISYNPNTSEKSIRKLFDLKERSVTFALLNSPATPADILEELSYKVEYETRLVYNPTTPSHVLEKIYLNTKHNNVKREIFSHQNTPQYILDLAFKKLKNRLKNTIDEIGLDILISLAGNKSCSQEIFRFIAELELDSNDYLPLLATNSSVSSEILDLIKWENNTWIPAFFYTGLAENPNTSASLRKRVASSQAAQGAILVSPDVTLEEMALIDINDLRPSTIEAFLDKTVNINQEFLKKLIFEARLPYQVKYKACKHPSANSDDAIAYALSRSKVQTIHWWLLDRDEVIHEKFKQYVKDNYKIDIAGMTDDMIIGIMDWKL